MVFGVVGLTLVLLLPGLKVAGYVDYEDLSEQDDEDDYGSYDVDDEELVTSPAATNYDDVKSNRIRRQQDKEVVAKTLSPEDINEVKGALNQLLSGVETDDPITPQSTTPVVDYNPYSTETSTNPSSTTSSYSIPETSSFGTESPTNMTEDLTSIFKLVDDDWSVNIPSRSSKLTTELGYEENILRLPSANESSTNKGGKTPQIDIAKLMDLISNLAKDFEGNLSRKLNESIANMSIPTCTTPTPPTTTLAATVTDEYDANYTGAIIAKCFVCGLDVPGIPQHAHCADAFAGDFLPLVPVDTSAKGKISRYRKYCKYANIRGYRVRAPQSRVIIGRWTGGCAVRWVDLSGVYTQRTCRNRLQPTMGLHFASKRMAKLERALWNIENGCIISPVASLTPLSRGVSLYARFHACVCTGSWCNGHTASCPARWTVYWLCAVLAARGAA